MNRLVFFFWTATAGISMLDAAPPADIKGKAEAALGRPAAETTQQKLMLWIQRIWDRAEHSAFTDLVKFRNRYYCAFREGSGHIPGLNGVIRVIESDDAQNWRSVALLDEPHVDLRDPKLSVRPDGRLVVNMGGSFYLGTTRMKMESRVSFADADGRNFTKPQPVAVDEKVHTSMDWLWRITWHKGVAWSAVQQVPQNGPRSLQLVRSEDAISWKHIHTFDLKAPSETTLRFLPDDTLVALIRHGGNPAHGFIGTSRPPYTAWQLRESNKQLGGPNFILLPDGRLLAATRTYDDPAKAGAELCWLDPGSATLTPIIRLPSAGDCSYMGLVLEAELDRVLISYYSSHEEKAAIYLAAIRLSGLR